MIYVSPDARRWASITNLRALRKVLGIEQGSLGFGLTITEKEGLSTTLSIRAK